MREFWGPTDSLPGPMTMARVPDDRTAEGQPGRQVLAEAGRLARHLADDAQRSGRPGPADSCSVLSESERSTAR